GTTPCEEFLIGNFHEAGGWYFATAPIQTKITPDQLQLMCVSEQKGYVPTETWTHTDGSACACGTDYEVNCDEGPADGRKSDGQQQECRTNANEARPNR